MQIANGIQDSNANLEATRLRARSLTQQLVSEHQQKLGGAEGAAAAGGAATATQDVSALSEEAVQSVSPTQQQQGADVDGLVKALHDHVNGKLDAADGAQKPTGAEGAQKPKPADGAQGKHKKVQVEVEFQPSIQANTIQAPGDAIGEFKVHKTEVDKPAGPGGSKSAQAGSASAAGNAPAGAAGAGGQGGNGVDRTELSDEAQGMAAKPAQGAEGLSTSEDGKDREIKMSGQAAEAMKGQFHNGQAPQSQGAGMIVDSAGSAAPIPQDGGTLRTNNWEQSIWVHPGGSLEQSGGLIERYRKLDDSPSQIWFDKRGQSTDEVAKQFQTESAKKPGASESGDKTREAEKLRNPTEST